MNNDLYEYRTFSEVTQKTENEAGIYIDDQRIKEILNRPVGYGKDAYWSFYKLGKSPSALKSPFLDSKKPKEIKFEEDEAFIDEEYTFEDIANIEFDSSE